MNNARGGKTHAEAGHEGGTSTREQRGHDFYREIGSRGGEQLREERGLEHFQQIGATGGAKLKAERGRAHYEAIGRKGQKRAQDNLWNVAIEAAARIKDNDAAGARLAAQSTVSGGTRRLLTREAEAHEDDARRIRGLKRTT